MQLPIGKKPPSPEGPASIFSEVGPMLADVERIRPWSGTDQTAVWQEIASAGAAISRLRILLVEDSPSSVFLFREALRHPDTPPAELLLAYTGEDAMRMARGTMAMTGMPVADIIVLDLSLPHGMNGLDILRELRRDDQPILTPVCILTVSDSEDDMRRAYELGANCYIQKPMDMQGFVHTIRNFIRFWSMTVRCGQDADRSASRP